MKQGLMKFTSNTQGARTKEGQKKGENFVKEILEILGIENLKETTFKRYNFNFFNKNNKKASMTPDFIIQNSKTGMIEFKNKKYLFLESKYKQISGSDWEKIESNFGYHEHFYNNLCNISSKTIVILSGYWEELQKSHYHSFIEYLKINYGKYSIFDFGNSNEEIFKFCELLDIKLNEEIKNKIKACRNNHQRKPE